MSTLAHDRTRPNLSRDVIAATALELTVVEPLTPLTLARLGAELGADPTAVYRHYRNRNELIADLLDRVYGDVIDALRPTGDWRDDLRQMATSLRSVLLVRPALAAEAANRFSGGPNERRGVEYLNELFQRAGFVDDDVVLHARAFAALLLATIIAGANTLIEGPELHAHDRTLAGLYYGPNSAVDSATYEQSTFDVILRTHLIGLESILAGDS